MSVACEAVDEIFAWMMGKYLKCPQVSTVQRFKQRRKSQPQQIVEL